MVEVAALIVTGLGMLWGVITYFRKRSDQSKHEAERRRWELKLEEERREFQRELERERRRHAEMILDLQQRNAAVHDVNGLLRDIQHCVEDHGGEPHYQDRIDQGVKKARAFVLAKSSLLGDDVVTAVQKETSLSAEVFTQRRTGATKSETERWLADARGDRVRLLRDLGRVQDPAPPPGSRRSDHVQ